MTNCAFVTLLTKASYLPGTLVLDQSLKNAVSQYPLVVMVTPTLPDSVRAVLQKRGIPMRLIEPMYPDEGQHSLAAHDERFADTWTKLRVFDLVEFKRVVLLDSDMILKKNMDELMVLDLLKDQIAAVHVCACNPRKLAHYPSDWIPTNCAHSAVTNPLAPPMQPSDTTPRPYSQLNSGTVVLNPSMELANRIRNFLETSEKIGSFSFPDQDLLTEFFKNKWKPLPWYYNALKTLRVIHPQEWSDEHIRCVHYILHDKPWRSRITPPESIDYELVNSWWWEQFDEVVTDMKNSDEEGVQLVLANVNMHA
ncbi:nucleotide-diphospho-sugar transferase [Cyathus striatus]|nr:nucleotide-diphospho-sugar transferase [Cyathus striatus]